MELGCKRWLVSTLITIPVFVVYIAMVVGMVNLYNTNKELRLSVTEKDLVIDALSVRISAGDAIVRNMSDVLSGYSDVLGNDYSELRYNSSNVRVRKHLQSVYTPSEYIDKLEDAVYSIWSVAGDAIVEDVTNYYGDIYDIPPELLRAQIEIESRYDPLAQSVTDDVGISQLSTKYVSYFKKAYDEEVVGYKNGIKPKFNRLNPISAIATQAFIMHDIRELLKDDKLYKEDTWVHDVLSAYNMGYTRYIVSGRNSKVNGITPVYLDRIAAILNRSDRDLYSVESLHNKGVEYNE